MASFRKRGCKCPKDQKKCTCGATWSFRLSVKDPTTGERIQPEGNGFKTRKLAVEAAAKMHTEILSGTYIKEKDILFEELANDFMRRYAASGKVKQSSIDTRATDTKRLNKVFGKRKAKDITKLIYQEGLYEIQKNYTKNDKRGYSKNSMLSTHSTACMIFKFGIEMELIKKDPTEYAVIPYDHKTVEELEVEDELPKYLEKEQLVIFLKFIHEHKTYQEYAQFHILAYTGMRIGELHALKISDVNIANKTISITKTLYTTKKSEGQYTLHTPKTKSSKRIITIDDTTLNVIKKQIADLNEFKMAHRKTFKDQNFLFVNRIKHPGDPLPKRDTQISMKSALKSCGLPLYFTPHTLRHTHVSLLSEMGIELETIQERLGHKNDTLTRIIYLHITKPMKRDAAERFAAGMNLFF